MIEKNMNGTIEDKMKLQTVSTEVYYLYEDEIMRLLDESGFVKVKEADEFNSTKSWYITAIKA
jgi:hypothetical protein